MSQSLLSRLLDVTQATVSRWESGKQPIPAGIESDLIEMEELVEEWTDLLAERWEADPTRGVELPAWGSDEAFWAANPQWDGVPAMLYRIAMARGRLLANDPNTVRIVEAEG